MKLGLHLLETCRLRKETSNGALYSEAEWWEVRIARGLQLQQALEDLHQARYRLAKSERARKDVPE